MSSSKQLFTDRFLSSCGLAHWGRSFLDRRSSHFLATQKTQPGLLLLWVVAAVSAIAQAKAPLETPPAPVSVAPMALQVAVAASVPTDTTVQPGPTPPLPPVSEKWTQTLNQIVPDPPPPRLVRGTHYVISNEDRHDLWKATIEKLGGAYIGVGTDQNYVLAGWQRPQLLVLFDFDQVVVDLHFVYRAFFLNADSPGEFRALWETKNEATALRLLADCYPNPKQRAQIVAAYKMSRYSVLARFRKVEGIYKVHNVSWFLNEPQQYQHLAQLFRAGRVVLVRGDLTVGTSLSSIGAALSALSVPVNILYLSNAERYFTYTEGFRKSALSLRFGPGAQVLRTRARPNGVYMYVVQDAENFQKWTGHPKVSTVYQVTHRMDADPNPGLFYIRKTPEAVVPQIPHPPSAHLKSK